MHTAWFIMLALLASLAAPALRAASLLETAVHKWSHEVDRWSFVQHVREYRGGKLYQRRVERFDPSQPDESRWELLRMNGRPPTTEEVHAFNARKNDRPRAKVEPPEEYIDFPRATIIAETEDTVVYQVAMRSNVSLLVPFQNVTARVAIDKDMQTIRSVDVGLREEMRIALGIAKVKKLDLAFTLVESPPAPDENAAAPGDPASAEPDGQGSATITTLGRRLEIHWRDFVRVDKRPAS